MGIPTAETAREFTKQKVAKYKGVEELIKASIDKEELSCDLAIKILGEDKENQENAGLSLMKYLRTLGYKCNWDMHHKKIHIDWGV